MTLGQQLELYDLCDQLKRDVGHWDWEHAREMIRRLELLIEAEEVEEEKQVA